jgi:hypothetical protein
LIQINPLTVIAIAYRSMQDLRHPASMSSLDIAANASPRRDETVPVALPMVLLRCKAERNEAHT